MPVIKIYRDDSTTPVVYERVKHAFMIADNTVLVLAQVRESGDTHDYIHWPISKICWWKLEK